MILGDFHTHTRYSDGKGKISDNVESAVALGLKQIGLSDHGLYHIAFGLRQPDLSRMRAEVDKLKGEQPIEIYLGVEANIITSEGAIDLKGRNRDYFDYVIAGYHKAALNPSLVDFFKYNFVGLTQKKFTNTQIDRFTHAFVKAIESGKIDIVSHLFYGLPVNTVEVAKAAADYGVFVELNGKKVSIPDEDMLTLIDNKNVQFIINSDAHSPERVGEVSIPTAFADKFALDKSRIVNWDKLVRFNRKK